LLIILIAALDDGRLRRLETQISQYRMEVLY